MFNFNVNKKLLKCVWSVDSCCRDNMNHLHQGVIHNI